MKEFTFKVAVRGRDCDDDLLHLVPAMIRGLLENTGITVTEITEASLLQGDGDGESPAGTGDAETIRDIAQGVQYLVQKAKRAGPRDV